MRPEDPRTVHYLIPCEAVRGQNYLCSNYYFAVNCHACLDNRPPPKISFDTNSTALKITIWALLGIMAPLAALMAFIFLKEGRILLGVIPLAILAIMVESILHKLLMRVVRPIAAKIMGRPFNQHRR